MKTIILRTLWVSIILLGVMIMGAENSDGGFSFLTIFIGFVFEAFAWAMWENCPELRASVDDDVYDDRF